LAKKFIVPLITSYYEYVRVEAESPEEAVEIAKDAGGEDTGIMDFREVIAIGDDAGIVVEE
jgi:hypothetical protein